ncbi:YqjK-like family protein [Cedecea neteri]|uniref:YqjK-like family protein n=1 Tax=Cedecea neteri TaxID=158822 RepID=UPI0005D8E54C|nr:YqjK-like family protein [Cedecea neteri]AJZ87966.1 membrane protein [Klebsiella michiganensis]WPU22552.1 YqjK-like family protein [Cedecea neteri]
MSDAERVKRKAYLLSQVQQQRLDLSAAKRDWLQVTSPYDRGWNTLVSLRSYAMIASSVLAIWTVKHPGKLMRWAKRGFGAWSTWRLIRNTLNPPVR